MSDEKNRFVFIAPMYNASITLSRMLHSICAQSYKNWMIYLIDDVSSHGETVICSRIIQRFEDIVALNDEDPTKITVTWNVDHRGKCWEVLNVLHGISKCSDNDIVCRIDADDALCDNDALAIMNTVYETTKCDAAWSMHRWGLSDRNISAAMLQGVDVYKHPWCASHLKTFRKRLIDGVPYENFLNESNEPVRRAGDQAIYLPVLHRCHNWQFVPRALYAYNIDEQNGAVYQTDDAKFQRSEAEFIRARGYVNVGKPWEQFV